MKKHLIFSGSLTLLVMLIGLQKLSAQNTSPFWSLAGNNNATFKSKLGTTNNVSLRFYTNNAQRAILDSLGRLGLGTNAPAAKLHAVQTAGSSTAIYGQATGAGSYGVWGSGVTRGVFGSTVSGFGVYGQSTSGTGVYGTGKNYGVYGFSASGSGAGVYGIDSNWQGVYGKGGSFGVYGESKVGYGLFGSGGYAGVYGQSTATSGGYGVYGYNGSDAGYGVYGINTSTGGTGVYGKGFSAVWGQSTGGYGVVGSGGVYSVAGFNTISGGVLGESNYLGVYGLCNQSTTNPSYAVLAQNFGTTSGSYGVYAVGQKAVWGNCTVGGGQAVTGFADAPSARGGVFTSRQEIGVYAQTSNSSSYAGFFIGNVFTTGSYLPSDRQFKQNITDVTNAMDIINKLQPKNYEYRQDGNFKFMNLPQGKQYGLIAQEVEQVLPNMVKETKFDLATMIPGKSSAPQSPTQEQIKSGMIPLPVAPKEEKQENAEVINFKSLNYTQLIPIMIKGMQELSKENEDLKKEVADLKALITKNSLTGNGYNLDAASLDQNTPNPFNSATIIRYHLPETAANAKVVITDASGRTMKSISLTGRGVGEINLNTGTFAAGTYNYTLWVDGKQIDSRKMIIAK